ncbi:MAG: hypothetical protein NTV79_05285 [Candidatus Aureabacteria bacterium]|nr:hypothetical protein [Candidatus Auribacterota bacterium]
MEVASDEGRADARESLSFSISARHLFGRPAAEAPVTAWAEFLDEAFAPSGWEGWVFGDPEKKVLPPSQNLGNSRLNEEGRGEIVVPVSEGWRPNGALQVVFGCSVMETGGRSVAAYASRSLDVYPFYLGLKLPPAEGYRRIGEEIPVAAAAVRPDGAPETAAAEVELALNRVFWSTVLKKNAEGVYSYASERQVSPVSRQTVALSAGRGEAAITPGEAGEYLLTIRDPASGSSSSTSFFAAGPDQEWLAWSLESPEKVELTLDRESYLPGDTAVLLIKSPFPGKALLSIESDRVLETRILILDKNTAEAKIPVLPEFAPNVYCSVSVIRPVKAGEKWAGHRAAGTVPLSVASPDRRLNLALSAPETIRPRETLSVRLFLTDSRGDPRAGEAVLLAVDEGICLLTDFPAPDPFSFFFGQRRQEVELCDLYALLMPETEGRIASGPSAPGGDGEMGAALRRRLNPVTARRFQPVALVSGPVAVGEDGEAEISFSVPEFTGRLRLMAVALDQQGFGAASSAATVKRPLVVKSSLPRFLAPEDRCLLPVEIFNETGVDGEVRVEVEGRGGIAVEAPDGKTTTSAQTLGLPAGNSGTVSFRLSAPNHTGAAGVVLRAMLGGERYEESFEIPVRPASGLVSTSGAGQVKPGGDQEIDLPVDYLAGTGRYDFRSSGHPVLKLGGGLDYLLSYPYGCIEQTVSGSFPLLYLSDLAGEIRPGSLGPAEVEHYVQAGILRVLSMQVAGGGFSFWPAGRDLYDWGSVYAAHFLVEADRAGYDVPRDRRETALAYLQSLLSRAAESPGDVTTPAWRDQMHLKSYAGLVLALAGKPETGWIARLAEEKDYLDPSSRLNVAAALLATGRREEAIALLGVPGAIPEAARELGGGLRSRTRDDAVLLSLRLDLDPKDPSVPVLAARLETAARGGTWATTHENALALMALGKYCRFFAGTAKKINGSVKGFSGEDAVVTKDHPFHQTFDGVPAGPIRLINRGEGNLYYYWRAEGVPPRPAEEESDRGIAARRKFKDLSLHEIDPAVLRQGDLVVVELVLDAGDEYLDNVAIEDLLPAGLEIENPDLKTSRLVAGIDEKTTLPIRYSDVRDDRMIVFTGGFTGRKSYFYAARAVTAGEFVYPALSASCMYDPSIRSVHGRGVVRVISDQ